MSNQNTSFAQRSSKKIHFEHEHPFVGPGFGGEASAGSGEMQIENHQAPDSGSWVTCRLCLDPVS